MLDLPFTIFQRILGVLVLLALGALIDWLVKRERARRWKDYLFLIGCGATGAVFGVLIDQVTSRISQEYFLFGKGIPEEGFALEVIKLGAQAGMTAGVITGGVLLVGNSLLRKASILPVTGLMWYVIWAMMGAVLAAIVLGCISVGVLPNEFFGDYNDLVPLEEMPRFRGVFGAHCGLYLGGILSTVLGVVHFRRKNQRA